MLLWMGKQWTTKEGARKGRFRARMHLTAVTSSHDLPPEFVLLAVLVLSQGQLSGPGPPLLPSTKYSCIGFRGPCVGCAPSSAPVAAQAAVTSW